MVSNSNNPAAVKFDLATIAGLNAMLDATQGERDAARAKAHKVTAGALPAGLTEDMVLTWITYRANVKRHSASVGTVARANGWTTIATVGTRRVIVRRDGSVSSARGISLGGGNYGCEVVRLGEIVDGVFVVSSGLSPRTAEDAARFARDMAAGF